MTNTVALSVQGSVAKVTLNRPDVRNAFNAEMIAELTQTFLHLSDRVDVGMIVLDGNGPSFSAGADVAWMRASLEATREENVADARRMSAMFSAIERTPQPVIAAVQGACLGGGMGLIAVCDCVVASDDANFGFTETKLGLIPAVISAFVLPKIGESWARALFPTGERFGAEVAQRIGLVHWIVASEAVRATVLDKLREVSQGGPTAVRDAKRLVVDARNLSLEEQSELTAQRIAAIRVGPEAQEGLRAFLQKRSPSWRRSPPGG